jgi:hypothetical protein
MRGKRSLRGLLIVAGLAAALPAAAQVRPGPIPPPTNAPPVVGIDAEPKPDPPPIAPDEIVKRFTENEEANLRAHAGYAYRRVVQVQEVDDQGKVTGTFEYNTEIAQLPDGRVYEREVKHPESSLNVVNLEPDDLSVLSKIPPLPFTATQAPKYDFTYLGTQKLDELNTYIFRVKFKQVERSKAYFDGVIWVDDQDFVIVKTTGRWMTELGEVTTQNFPFKFFDTYRENIQGKIWFPSYVRSDERITTKKGTFHVRLIVRWEDYKPLSAATAASSQP